MTNDSKDDIDTLIIVRRRGRTQSQLCTKRYLSVSYLSFHFSIMHTSSSVLMLHTHIYSSPLQPAFYVYYMLFQLSCLIKFPVHMGVPISGHLEEQKQSYN